MIQYSFTPLGYGLVCKLQPRLAFAGYCTERPWPTHVLCRWKSGHKIESETAHCCGLFDPFFENLSWINLPRCVSACFLCQWMFRDNKNKQFNILKINFENASNWLTKNSFLCFFQCTCFLTGISSMVGTLEYASHPLHFLIWKCLTNFVRRWPKASNEHQYLWNQELFLPIIAAEVPQQVTSTTYLHVNDFLEDKNH